MKRVLVGLAIALAIFFAAIILYFGPMDSCLDRGGCWDSVDKVCRKDEPNAQELCDRK